MLTKKRLIFFCILFFSCALPLFLSAAQQNSAEFAKGYLISKLEDRFGNAKIEIEIQDQQIIVYYWPEYLECEQIKSYLENFSSYPVKFDNTYQPIQPLNEEITSSDKTNSSEESNSPDEPFEEGGFLPEISPFFPTMLAQPHILGYSIGYRSYDKVFRTSCIPVSIGDQFSLYQFKTVSLGRLYFGIEACVWAIFEGRTKSLSLINADYYVALPLTYINNRFSARLRLFHESSHLGDEYLLENKKIVRVNPSMEVVDLSLAYELFDKFTLFTGYSRVLRSDDSFKIKPNSFYYGFNYFLDFFKINICNVEAIPYVSTYFANQENNKWGLDTSAAIGYQWNKSYGHKLRIYLEGHDGYSAEGQFSKRRTRYLSLKLLYGY
jgi:hypothetical protein